MNPVVYVSGPISGHPNGNRDAFDDAAQRLRSRGFMVVNPFEVFTEPPPEDPMQMAAYWQRAMRADVKALMDCTHITTLAGWERSRGATIETRLAADIGIHRVDLGTALTFGPGSAPRAK